MVLPRLAASGAMSVRIQSAIAEAMVQRRIAAGLTEHPPLVRQHHRLQPHQILAAAAAGAMDVGNAGGDRDRSVSASRQAEGCGAAACAAGLSASAGACLPAAGLSGSSAGASAGRGFGNGTEAGSVARRSLRPALPEQVAPGPLRRAGKPSRGRSGLGLAQKASAAPRQR